MLYAHGAIPLDELLKTTDIRNECQKHNIPDLNNVLRNLCLIFFS